jgi:negative regulator of sigma E activity
MNEMIGYHRSSDDKLSARVNMVDGLVREILCGDDVLDDLLHDLGPELLELDLVRVLR